MKRNVFLLIIVLLLTSLACNLAKKAPETPVQKGEPNPVPVPISEGLASLNSYRMLVTIVTRGPTPGDVTTVEMETQRSQELKARYTHVVQTTQKVGQENETSEIEFYRIGNDICSKSSEEWSWASLPANQAEMSDLVMGMFDFTPINDNPVFVGKETINGIPSNHFTFKIAGLGVESGAEVTENQGDYWLAADGQYYVKYVLVAETVMDPNTNVIRLETRLELTNVNQPLDISFPQACLDAAGQSE